MQSPKMDISVTPDRWLSVEEVIEHLGIDKDIVYARVKAGGANDNKMGDEV